MKRVFFIVLLFAGLKLFASDVTVEGNAPDYAGKEVVFYKYADRITLTKEEVFRFTVDKSGKYSAQCNVSQIIYVFAETGIYHAYFYLEPGHLYNLILPEYVAKTAGDELNPFFEPIPVHIGIKGLQKTDLNYLIMDFDYFYDEYVDEKFLDIYTKGHESDVDTFINEISSHYAYADNKFFKSYEKFRFAGLRYLAYQRNRYEISYRNYTLDSIGYENPAYMDLFNELYKNFFDDQLTEIIGPRLFYEVYYGHCITNIKLLFSVLVELKNDRLKELVILKGLHDAFYNVNYAWTPLLLTLDSLCIITKYPEHRIIGQNIADKVLSMAVGTIAPPFAFPDSLGDTVKLAKFRNEFIYLSFINTQSYTCQQQLDLLEKLHQKHGKYFRVISIITDADVEQAKKYLEKGKYTWDFLYSGGDQKIIDFYKIKAYPSYFLVGPSGILLMSPAPTPLENFEKAFFDMVEQQ